MNFRKKNFSRLTFFIISISPLQVLVHPPPLPLPPHFIQFIFIHLLGHPQLKISIPSMLLEPPTLLGT